MANLTEIIWKKCETYRGQHIYSSIVDLYAVRIGLEVKASFSLSEVRRYVDAYWKSRAN